MKLKLSLLFLCLIALLWSCPSDDYRYVALGGSIYSSTTIPRQTYNAVSFFWGTWISMADGKSYNMQEQKVVVGDKWYWYKSGTTEPETTGRSVEKPVIVVDKLGTFVKQSDSVIINNNIPYFRQGGANLTYKIKLVGFSNDINSNMVSRADATVLPPLKNKKIKATSQTYSSFNPKENDATTDVNGEVTLIAPTVNDVQTITVPKDGGGSVIVPNVKIETSGSNMGTIAVVQEGDYSLKVYGEVTNKDDGYMYVRSDKWYQMNLVIKNVSDVVADSSSAVISSDDNKLSIRAKSNDDNLNDVGISQMKPGASKTIAVELQYSDIDEGYVDTTVKIRINNFFKGQVWEDYVPLRFFKGQYDFTIAASATEHNQNAMLNGFIIYPDKNNQYFTVGHNAHKTIKVPSFMTDDDYLLVFSGATVEGNLSDSTEMYYTVKEGDSKRDVLRDSSKMIFGGENYTEDAAFSVYDEPFEAYLSAGKVKYFKIRANNAISVE